SPAWTRPGARSARRGHSPPHCIAGRFVIGDRTMFKTPTIRGRRTLRTRYSSFRGNHTRPQVELLEDRMAPAVLTVNYTGDTVSGTTATLDLREAILLVNSGGTATDSSGNSLAAAKPGQIDTTSSVGFGSNDTIQFNIPTSDPGYTAPTSVAVTNV